MKMSMMAAVAFAAAMAGAEGTTVLELSRNGIDLKVDADRTQVDPAKSVFLTLSVKTPADVVAKMPDLRDRVRGFSLAEDFEEEPKALPDGSTVQTVNWRLVPEPCAEAYKVAPFVVKASPRLLSSESEDGSLSFYAGPLRFSPPPPRDVVTGGMEADPKKDMPPLTWRLAALAVAALVALAAIAALAWFAVRYLARRVREHRMSPIERAWAELDRLLGKGLPGRGRYKDFYVELTMVVRRYVQRKYGIRAPHLTTEEFLAECGAAEGRVGDAAALRAFLESADMVKFAGVQATPEMADEATEGARDYLAKDSVERGGAK